MVITSYTVGEQRGANHPTLPAPDVAMVVLAGSCCFQYRFQPIEIVRNAAAKVLCQHGCQHAIPSPWRQIETVGKDGLVIVMLN
jgi:hypothetical protein